MSDSVLTQVLPLSVSDRARTCQMCLDLVQTDLMERTPATDRMSMRPCQHQIVRDRCPKQLKLPFDSVLILYSLMRLHENARVPHQIQQHEGVQAQMSPPTHLTDADLKKPCRSQK